MRLSKLNNRGDTILEVLISVAILSLILATIFVVTNNNSQYYVQAGERNEATNLAQSELEKLKLFYANTATDVPDEGQYFCMSQDGESYILLAKDDATGVPGDRNDDIQFQSSIYKDECKTDVGDSGFDQYHRLMYRNRAPNQDTYESIIRWSAVTGNGVDEVRIVHRLHPNVSLVPGGGGGSPIVIPYYSKLNGDELSDCLKGRRGTTITSTNPGCYQCKNDIDFSNPNANPISGICDRNGIAMFMRRNMAAEYTFKVPPKDTTLNFRLKYQQFRGAQSRRDNPSERILPAGYKFEIYYHWGDFPTTRTELDRIINGTVPRTAVLLPSAPASNAYDELTFEGDIMIPSNNLGTLTVIWNNNLDNNYAGDGYPDLPDHISADFQINTLELCQFSCPPT